MDIKTKFNGSIKGNQNIFACEMAGHIDMLVNDPVWHTVEEKVYVD